MSLPFKLLQLSPSIYSLCFESSFDSDLHHYAAVLKKSIPKVEEVLCTFDRVTLFFTEDVTKAELVGALSTIDYQKTAVAPCVVWEIPLYFDTEYKDLLTYFQGDQNAVIRYQERFFSLQFRLSFYGFLPGFGYLSGLPTSMHLDRKQNPVGIAKGDVAIGGGQVGVYPQASPGGWQRIGNCPVPWMDLRQDPSARIKPGDSIRFVAVDEADFHAIALQVKNNQYHFKKEIK